MPELTFDEESFRRAAYRIIEQGTADALGTALGDALGRGLIDRIAMHEIFVRHGSAPPDRDALAAMAMQGWLASFQGVECADVAGVAKFAYDVAAAMLAERARRAGTGRELLGSGPIAATASPAPETAP
jgi:hypothetical protein